MRTIVDLLHTLLIAFLLVIAYQITRMKDLFAIIMLTGSFSLLSAGLYLVYDAVDVAFTEASVGAGISGVLMLVALSLTKGGKAATETEKQNRTIPLIVVILTGAALIYGTFDMPHFGNPNAPIHQHVAPAYLSESGTKIGIPNVVTSVLASYRGYDTLGEVTVIFTAACGVTAILGGTMRRRKRKKNDKQSDKQPEASPEKSAEELA
ncbi:DUF4040 domain-containing protein [Magnetococcales bacterium HHB-1]